MATIQRRSDNGGGFAEGWRAGGLLAQFLPEAPERMRLPDLPGGDAPAGAEPLVEEVDDAWAEVKSLVGTVHPSELTDPEVGVERLLFRLFHERGVRVFEATPMRDDCSCSRERIKSVLANFTAEEIAESVQDNGRIDVTCEFCGQHYEFAPEEVRSQDSGE